MLGLFEMSTMRTRTDELDDICQCTWPGIHGSDQRVSMADSWMGVMFIEMYHFENTQGSVWTPLLTQH